MRYFLAFMLLLLSSPAWAECYEWPLRIGYQGEVAYDADTIYISMPGLTEELTAISVRVRGVDTPEIRGKCEDEQQKAREGRHFVLQLLGSATSVRFCSPKWGKYGGRVIADVFIDGENLAELLISKGLGRAYAGGRRQGWCPVQ